MKKSLIILTCFALGSISWQDTMKQQSIEKGEIIFGELCVACHMANGEGISGVFPPLAKSDFLLENIDKSIHAIKYGLQGEIVVNGTKYNSVMTPQQLSDEEVKDVLNYVLNSWGNKHDYIPIERVTKVKQ